MKTILLVEDDPTIAKIVAQELENWGFDVVQPPNFVEVLETFEHCAPQLVLLDLSLPHRSGFHWCAEIRKLSKVPILFISSAADNINMVTALHQGADDYIAKPFDLPVLVAKVQAILRRSYDFNAADTNQLTHRGAVLHLQDMSLSYQGKQVELTRNEFRILQQLMEHAGSMVSRETLIQRLWDDESFIDDNTLTVNINRLRKKLEEMGLVQFIQTKKREGYWLPN